MDSSLRGWIRAVDNVSSVGGELHAVNHLGGGTPWFCKLASNAAHLHNRNPTTKGQHNSTLKENSVGVPGGSQGRDSRLGFRQLET